MAIIEEILDFSRVDAGKEQIHSEETDLRQLAHDVARIVEPQAAARMLAIRVEGAEDSARAWTDPRKIRQILLNLVGNAAKYADPGEITVRLDGSDADWLHVHVEDRGPGIAPEEQERIFEPFTQVDASHTRVATGTGLGLAISRQLARILGGDVTLESVVGQGSTFPSASRGARLRGREAVIGLVCLGARIVASNFDKGRGTEMAPRPYPFSSRRSSLSRRHTRARGSRPCFHDYQFRSSRRRSSSCSRRRGSPASPGSASSSGTPNLLQAGRGARWNAVRFPGHHGHDHR